MAFASSGTVSIEYADHGEGPVVVFVPDACLGPWMWAWVAAELQGPMRVVTMALRGSAESDPAPAIQDEDSTDGYSPHAQARDIEAVLESVEAPRAHFVGCGLGGQIALAYAATHSRARSLTLLGTGETLSIDEETQDTLCMDDPFTSLTPYLGAWSDQLDTTQLRSWRTDDDPSPHIRRRQLAAAAAFDVPPLHEITVPTRVLHGTDDRVWPLSGGETLAANLPDATFDEVKETPHLLPVATPTLVADEIAALVTESTETT